MARIDPLPAEQLGELAEQWSMVEAVMGFVPNSMPTMARVPGLAKAFGDMGAAIIGNPMVSPALNQMVAQIASSTAGCRYCQAHTAHNAHRMGISEEKLAELWTFATSDHFDEAERAALTLAVNAAAVPNTATDEHFDELRKHFDDDQIAGIVATISFFGYLNRWNDTMATDLEDMPTVFAERVLGASGWEPGKHA